MLLDELIEVIDTLKQRISNHGPTLRENETRTRMVLIDPLLQVLGWDTSDPSRVVPEYGAGGGKADYALLGHKGHPSAVIEAKRLGEPLQPHLKQMVSYAALVGIKYAGITDGDQWELYEVLRPGPLEERRMLNLRISTSSSYHCALNLLLLWRPNLFSGQAQQVNEPIVFPLPDVDPVLPPTDPMKWVPLSEFDAHKATNCPKSIMFPDGSEHQTKYWYELTVRTVGWLWSKKILRMDNLSDFPSKSRHLFHTEPFHPSGVRFKNAKRVDGTDLYVEANMSGADSLEKTKALLKHYGQDLANVKLESDPT